MSLLPESLVLEETPRDGVVRLNIARLSESDLQHVRAQLFELAVRRRGQDLCLDLARLEYLSSSGLALLVALHRQVRDAGGCLRLCHVRETVYEVFAITRLTSILDVRCQTTEDESSVAASA
jgi:anti-anti-sigma factor